jgi:aspartate-semialdehyde dehydrogenase
MTTMTYQAASGSGAAKMLELVSRWSALRIRRARLDQKNALEWTAW